MPIIRCGPGQSFEVQVSREDYGYLLLFGHWSVTHPNGAGKRYAYRAHKRGSKTFMLWMHKVVLLRHLGPHVCPKHHIGDHRDGNSFNNRRGNLRWATYQMNARNVHGLILRQPDLFDWRPTDACVPHHP